MAAITIGKKKVICEQWNFCMTIFVLETPNQFNRRIKRNNIPFVLFVGDSLNSDFAATIHYNRFMIHNSIYCTCDSSVLAWFFIVVVVFQSLSFVSTVAAHIRLFDAMHSFNYTANEV